MERLFVNNNFSYIRLIPVANGASWTAASLAKEIASKFKTANANPTFIIVWLDTEKQSCGSSGLEATIRAALVAAGADPARIFMCVPDQMSENIILADETLMRSELRDSAYAYAYEGQNGKSIINNLFLAAAGRSYRATTDGVRLLKRMRLWRAALSSQSADRFYQQVRHIPCWWILDAVV